MDIESASRFAAGKTKIGRRPAMDELIGLIPAAGKGLRLGLPYPKELYPVIRDNRYKPVAQFVLENLLEAGVRHIVFVVNETKHQLMGFFGSGRRFGCDISYVVQERRRDERGSRSPGLADALDSAYHLTRAKTVCFGMADTIMSPEDVYSQVLSQRRPTDDFLLGLFRTNQPNKFGMVVHNQEGYVHQVVDKPQITDLTHMWGLIVWRPTFTEHLHICVQEKGIGDFAAVLNLAIEQNLVARGVTLENASYADLGTYEEITSLESKQRSYRINNQQ